MAFKDDVKQWFETGDYPTQAQFWQKFEWLRWKDEKIAFEDLDDDLKELILAIPGTILLEYSVRVWKAKAGTMLEKFFIGQWPGLGGATVYTVNIGTTPGGYELFQDVAVDTSDPQSGILTKDFYCIADTLIYFTITGTYNADALIKIYKY